MSVSYLLDDNEVRYRQEDVEVLEFPDGTREEIHYYGVAPYLTVGRLSCPVAVVAVTAAAAPARRLRSHLSRLPRSGITTRRVCARASASVQLAGSGGAGGSPGAAGDGGGDL